MMFIPLLSACGGGGGDSGSEPSSLSSVSISGKLAQAYVGGATIIADKKESGSLTGNCKLDAGEIGTTSSASGDFSLSVNYGNYVICTNGGSYKNSEGKSVAAAPMMTPAPDTNSTGWNVTPLTTLVTTQPSLKTKLDELGGWNADIASSSGVPGKLLRVAKTVETYWQVSTDLTSDSKKQLLALENLALTLKNNNLPTDAVNLKAITSTAIETSMNDNKIYTNSNGISKLAIKKMVEKAVNNITNTIPNTNDNIVEINYQKEFDDAKNELEQSAELTFSKKPQLEEVSPIGSTENQTPIYFFSSTYPGIINYSGSCSSDTKIAQTDINLITINKLISGTYSDCILTVTTSEGQTSDPLNISSFTILDTNKDERAPILSLVDDVDFDKYPSTNSPSFIFHSDESGAIKVLGKCKSKHQYATSGKNNMFSFSDLSTGIYDDCKITVTDDSGNISDPLIVPDFEVKETSSIGAGFFFDPVIKKISCSYVENNMQQIELVAEANDDGGAGNLDYTWTLDNKCSAYKGSNRYALCIRMYGEKKITKKPTGSDWSVILEIDSEDGDYRSIKIDVILEVKDAGDGSTMKKQSINGSNC